MNTKKIIKKILILCMMFTTFSLFQINVNAAVFGATAVNNGNGTTTITISGPCVGGFVVSSGNASASIGKTTLDTNATVTLATGVGKFTIKVDAITVSNAKYELLDEIGEELTTSTSVTVTDNTKTPPPPITDGKDEQTNVPKKEIDTKDTISTLSSLTINTGTLSPAFAADTTSYSVQLPAGTKEIQVNASPASAKASISGIGKVSVNAGGNTIEILCTAENGDSTTYTITANVSETPVAMIQMGNKKFGVLNSDVNPGTLFVKVKIKIDGKEVDAWSNEELGMKLLYLQDEKTSEKNFYMYDEVTKKVTSIYKPFAYAGKNLVQVDVPENLQQRKGMKYTKVVMGQHHLSGWKFDDKKFDNYIIIYVLDETGKAVYYQYDKKADTLQEFSQAAAISQDKYEAYVKKMEKQTTYLFIGLLVAVLIAIFFFVLMLVIIIRRKKNKYKKVNINGNQQQSNISLEAAALMHDNLDK